MDNFYNLAPTEFSAAVIVLNIVFCLVLELVIVYIYKKTHQGLSYSSSFVFTFVLVGVLGAVIMMVVQHNLARAFGLLGAFSLIRFRTILKETRDIAFLFFALAIGIAIGTSNYAIAFISTFLISGAIWLFYRYNVGQMRSRLGHILTFSVPGAYKMDDLRALLKEYTESFQLLQARAHGEYTRYVFAIQTKETVNPADIVGVLRENKHLSDLELLSEEGGVEY